MFKPHIRGWILGLTLPGLVASLMAASIPLPPGISINRDAGRGGLLLVTLSLEDGEKIPFWLDTGASGTVIDRSLVSKLGKPMGAVVMKYWGVIQTNEVYQAPKLYLGGVRLQMTGTGIIAQDLSADGNIPVKGILGMDVLEHYCIQLDFTTGQMRFLDDEHSDQSAWGNRFSLIPLNEQDNRPAVAANLLGEEGPHSLIDSGCDGDGWLMSEKYRQWTNQTEGAFGEVHSPKGRFEGVKYPLITLREEAVESDGIGLRFLARHLVTLDFPKHELYLRRESVGPLPNPDVKTPRMEVLDGLMADVIQEDADAANRDLAAVEQGQATEFEKSVARHLVATLRSLPQPEPSDASTGVVELPLGDTRAVSAEVGWLKPAANRIPLNSEIISPLLDSGRIYSTGLFAHAPSRYVYNLGGKWKRLRGEAGLHTAFQGQAYGVIFSIQTDNRESYRSEVIRSFEHIHYDVDLTGAKTVALVVEKAQERNGGNWALWLGPTLYR